MNKIIYILLSSLVFHATIFDLDTVNSSVKWKGSKSTGSYHDGFILLDKSFIKIDKNEIKSGEIIIDMNSITCTDIDDPQSNEYLIKHLKNDDFFSVSKFPIASLKIHSAQPVEGNINKSTENQFMNGLYLFICDLTIKDSTHTIDFVADVTINQSAAVAIGKIEIDRSKFGIKYKSKSWYPDLGDRFINDIFELYFNLVAFPGR